MANRYTSLTQSQFSPLSLEEIMAVPLYKETKHNELNTLSDDLNSLLKPDPYKKYYDEASNIKNEMDQKLSTLSLDLAKNGYDANKASQFRSLKKEYDDLISPMGKIGQINAQNIKIKEDKENYLANMTKMGYSPEDAKRNWDIQEKKYLNDGVLYDNGKVINMNPALPPNYYNLYETADKYFDKAGVTEVDWKTIQSSFNGDGTSNWIDTITSGESLAHNNPQLNNALQFLKNEVYNPKSEIYKSFNTQGISPDEAVKTWMAQKGIYEKDKYSVINSNDISNLRNNDSGSKTKTDKIQSLYREDREEASLEINNYNVKDIESIITNLHEGNLDPNNPKDNEEIKKARRLERQYGEVNSYLNHDPIYSQLKNESNKIKSNLVKQNFSPEIKDYILSNNFTGLNFDPFGDTTSEENSLIIKNQNEVNRLLKINNQMASLKENAIKNFKMPLVSFTIDQTNQSAADWKAHGKQFVQYLQRNLDQKTNNIKLDSVLFKGEKINLNDANYNSNYEEIAQNVITAAMKGDNFNTSLFTIENENGIPMVELSITPTEEFKINGINYFDEKNIDGTFTARIALADFTREGVEHINNLFIKPLESLGGFYGKEAADDMRYSAKYKDITSSYSNADFSQSNLIKNKSSFLKNNFKEDINIFFDTNTKRHYFELRNNDKNKDIQSTKTLKWKDVLPSGISDLENIPSGLLDELYDSFIRDNSYNITDQNIETLDPELLEKYLINWYNTNNDTMIGFTSKVNALRSFDN